MSLSDYGNNARNSAIGFMKIFRADVEEKSNQIQSDTGENIEKAKKQINEGSSMLGNLIKSSDRTNKKVPFYLDYSWQVYRAVFLSIIFILFFVFKGIENYLVNREFDKFLINVFNIVSFFTLINITIYFFMVTFNRYRSTVKGKKGPRGPRGKRGLQGSNSNCDICNVKTSTMKKMYNKAPLKEEIKNEDVVVDMANPPDKGWRVLNTINTKRGTRGGQIVDDYFSNPDKYLNVMDNSYIGVDCKKTTDLSGSSCFNYSTRRNQTYKKQKTINLFRTDKETGDTSSLDVVEQRPIIGVAANTSNNKVTSLQYFVDNNAKHSKRRYTPELLGNRFGKGDNKDEKLNFVCPNNSAIYKVESLSNNNGIVGLKFHCQDVKTGKDVLVQDKNNYKSYGYTFGREPKENSKNYYYKSVQCNPVQAKNMTGRKKSKISQFYPTFISEVSGEADDKVLKNLKFHKCSYYKQS